MVLASSLSLASHQMPDDIVALKPLPWLLAPKALAGVTVQLKSIIVRPLIGTLTNRICKGRTAYFTGSSSGTPYHQRMSAIQVTSGSSKSRTLRLCTHALTQSGFSSPARTTHPTPELGRSFSILLEGKLQVVRVFDNQKRETR